MSLVLAFVNAEVLNSSEFSARICGATLSCAPLSLMSNIENTLLLLMPKLESDLPAFQKPLVKGCKDFESKILSCGIFGEELFSVPGSFKSNPLTNFVDDLISRFADSRRRDILVRARELMLSDYHNTMLGTGDALDDDPASAVHDSYIATVSAK